MDRNNNNPTLKERCAAPEPGGWADYIEARLDMRERTERLRALRLRRQAPARQGRDRSAAATERRR
ncbi:MAG: hypothetical protein K2Y27_15890 [Xanthobacteraceae bacterium]|nr:hypothetical protein [Xanthobacteraceae bacterium]